MLLFMKNVDVNSCVTGNNLSNYIMKVCTHNHSIRLGDRSVRCHFYSSLDHNRLRINGVSQERKSVPKVLSFLFSSRSCFEMHCFCSYGTIMRVIYECLLTIFGDSARINRLAVSGDTSDVNSTYPWISIETSCNVTGTKSMSLLKMVKCFKIVLVSRCVALVQSCKW